MPAAGTATTSAGPRGPVLASRGHGTLRLRLRHTGNREKEQRSEPKYAHGGFRFQCCRTVRYLRHTVKTVLPASHPRFQLGAKCSKPTSSAMSAYIPLPLASSLCCLRPSGELVSIWITKVGDEHPVRTLSRLAFGWPTTMRDACPVPREHMVAARSGNADGSTVSRSRQFTIDWRRDHQPIMT